MLYKNALLQEEKMADVHYDLANTYINLNDEDQAITHYLRAIELI